MEVDLQLSGGRSATRESFFLSSMTLDFNQILYSESIDQYLLDNSPIQLQTKSWYHLGQKDFWRLLKTLEYFRLLKTFEDF